MSDEITVRFPFLQLFESDSTPYALIDHEGKINWYNGQFKALVKSARLKGKKISSLFKDVNPDLIDRPSEKKSYTIFVPELQSKLTLTPFFHSNILQGFLIRIDIEADIETSQQNLLFQQELRDILTLLAKENSLEVLSDEILLRSTAISRSTFGIIAFPDDKSTSFLYYDPQNSLRNKDELERDVKTSLSYIIKWLEVNRKSLIALNQQNNIGYSLAKALESQSLIISPCIFENKLLAVIIVARKFDNYIAREISSIEQFAALLAFAISSIRAKDLNATLENRLMQSQKLETIGKLSSGMAHDFSNLLSSIFGSINLLKKKLPPNEDIFRLLDNIENCSVRAKDLTKGLLSFGKPTSKRKEIIKPNLLLSEISKVVNQTFPKKINFESKISDELWDVLGNSTEIYQVLLNLCVNAKEAIEGSGSINLTAENLFITDKNRIEHPILNKGKYVHISVSDSGSGIAEENLLKIFDPYFSTKSKDTGSGSGLGLYVTYGIIKAHGGHIEVTSILNKGTCFDVFLPSFEPTAVKEELTDEKIILLADDEEMLRDLLAELLESNGYNVIRVSSGVEAIRVLTEEIKADLLILDYNMPELDGVETIQIIRSKNFKMPIILSSGSEDIEGRFDLEELGIDAVLTKPYEFDTMLDRIRQMI